jgi:hypothetical protein
MARGALLAVVAATCAVVPSLSSAQTFQLVGANVQKRANGVLALMGYQLTPDVTTGSIAINNGTSGNPDFSQTSLGGGATLGKGFPLYLEGTAGYARYDPTFVASDGQEERSIPVKWNTLSVTGGIGWDFPIARNLVLRPIFNFTVGRVSSDGEIASNILQNRTGTELNFLENGQLDAYGLGGSIMLDYEHFAPKRDTDVELRYTSIKLKSYGSSADAVTGSADADSLSLWSRLRIPSGLTAFERPVRYVFEYAYTGFLGDLRGVLGFDRLNSFGVGLELDTSKYDMIVTRTRLVFRYKIGPNVSGYSIGLAMSF